MATTPRKLLRSIPDGAAPDAFVRAFQRLVGEVFRLNGTLLATADRLAGDLGVSTARWQVIATIRHQPLTAPDIARRLGLTRQSVQRTVNILVNEGLAEQRDNPGHRRSPLIALTRQGQRTMDRLRARQAQLTAEFTGELGLGLEDLEALINHMRALREAADRRTAGNGAAG